MPGVRRPHCLRENHRVYKTSIFRAYTGLAIGVSRRRFRRPRFKYNDRGVDLSPPSPG